MGIAQFSSSEFIVSQSPAEFINGVNVDGEVEIIVSITGSFIGNGATLSNVVAGGGIQLFAGSASGTPPSFDEWVTGSGGEHDILLSASSSVGHINHYCFISSSNGEWGVVQQGAQNGLIEQDNLKINGIGTGIYRYLIYGHSSASKATVVKGTTITINPGEL